jgi:hypothetical protein
MSIRLARIPSRVTCGIVSAVPHQADLINACELPGSTNGGRSLSLRHRDDYFVGASKCSALTHHGVTCAHLVLSLRLSMPASFTVSISLKTKFLSFGASYCRQFARQITWNSARLTESVFPKLPQSVVLFCSESHSRPLPSFHRKIAAKLD